MPRAAPLSFWIAIYVSTGIAFALALNSGHMFHWLLAPVILCGGIIGEDAVDWFRGRLSLLDPIGIIGLLGYYFFFAAPLLVVYWDYHLLYLPDQPLDYRNWIGGMAILNALGLLVYRRVRTVGQALRVRSGIVRWSLARQHFGTIIVFALVVSGGLQIWVYVSYGGISGYMEAYKAWVAGRGAFKGTGWIFAISESFPILAMMAYSVYARSGALRRTWTSILLVFAVFFALQILCGGLRGSRSNTIWVLFWGAGIVHFFVRPLPRRTVILGLPFLVGFMYLYGFYKDTGSDTLRVFSGEESGEEVTRGSKRNMQVLLLSDFGRSDVQAFLLSRVWANPLGFKYAFGRTYFEALTLLIPQSIWANRPVGKVFWTTQVEYGEGSYGVSWFRSSRVYGLAGEAMLNFGPLAVPFAFIPLGLAVGLARRMLARSTPFDSRLLIYPFVVVLCCSLLLNDSDNNLFMAFKYGIVPVLVVMLSSRKQTAGATVAAPLAHGTDVRFRLPSRAHA